MACRKLGDQRNKLILERPIKKSRSVCTIRIYKILLKVHVVGQGILMLCISDLHLQEDILAERLKVFGGKKQLWKQKELLRRQKATMEAVAHKGKCSIQVVAMLKTSKNTQRRLVG